MQLFLSRCLSTAEKMMVCIMTRLIFHTDTLIRSRLRYIKLMTIFVRWSIASDAFASFQVSFDRERQLKYPVECILPNGS